MFNKFVKWLKDTSGKTASYVVGVSAAIALTTSLIAPWEGLELKPYKDIVGKTTWCYGETRGTPKSLYTSAECLTLLRVAAAEFEQAIRPCLPTNLPVQTRASFISLSYNIGSTAFCKSSVAKKAVAGDLRGACNSILLYNKAKVNGKLQPVKGLTNRRLSERKQCLSGLGVS